MRTERDMTDRWVDRRIDKKCVCYVYSKVLSRVESKDKFTAYKISSPEFLETVRKDMGVTNCNCVHSFSHSGISVGISISSRN